MKVLSKGLGTRAVAVVLACAALQVAAQTQGPGETLTSVEARAARLRLEADPREARLGLWADATPVPPWEWRRTNRDGEALQ